MATDSPAAWKGSDYCCSQWKICWGIQSYDSLAAEKKKEEKENPWDSEEKGQF